MAGEVFDIPVINSVDEVVSNGIHVGRFATLYDFYVGTNKIGVKAALALESGDPKFIMGSSESFIAYINAAGPNIINSYVNSTYGPYLYVGWSQGSSSTDASQLLVPYYNTFSEAIAAVNDYIQPPMQYPITYSYTNSTVSGPSEAAVGDTVVVSAVPDVDYGITDASSQIIVTNNDIAVPYTWDAANQRITFTMPDPS